MVEVVVDVLEDVLDVWGLPPRFVLVIPYDEVETLDVELINRSPDLDVWELSPLLSEAFEDVLLEALCDTVEAALELPPLSIETEVVPLETLCDVSVVASELPVLLEDLPKEEEDVDDTIRELVEVEITESNGLRVPVKILLSSLWLNGLLVPVSTALTSLKPLDRCCVPVAKGFFPAEMISVISLPCPSGWNGLSVPDRILVPPPVAAVANGLFVPLRMFNDCVMPDCPSPPRSNGLLVPDRISGKRVREVAEIVGHDVEYRGPEVPPFGKIVVVNRVLTTTSAGGFEIVMKLQFEKGSITVRASKRALKTIGCT